MKVHLVIIAENMSVTFHILLPHKPGRDWVYIECLSTNPTIDVTTRKRKTKYSSIDIHQDFFIKKIALFHILLFVIFQWLSSPNCKTTNELLSLQKQINQCLRFNMLYGLSRSLLFSLTELMPAIPLRC